MEDFAVPIEFELAGWALFMAELEVAHEGANQLSSLRQAVTAKVRENSNVGDALLGPHGGGSSPAVRAAGCDPTR